MDDDYDQSKKIALAALLAGIWPHSLFMEKLTIQTPTYLGEFIDRADKFVNNQGMLRALGNPCKESKKVEKKAKTSR